MTVSQMAEALELTCAVAGDEARPVRAAYASDLLSDVMGNAPDEAVLITVQAHKNTVAVAVLKDSPAIIICNDRPLPSDMKEACRAEGIALFVTQCSQFTVSGRLYPLLCAENGADQADAALSAE
ncbi:hypothetical protein [Treponema brennaborense]|uniref:DRTGG domain-containing protein n=1 Tax=Treponema brennaborense (strain DSM 12168 / CIP 105900 / DD5/3) TaxID=906968 RepID=F4LMY0_TREBD|nr:hypothetical protein [Treponema brennaborense]AEE15766.1 hypothetical protein Trebr_0319 [Treponema brennaborense DSM 12168]